MFLILSNGFKQKCDLKNYRTKSVNSKFYLHSFDLCKYKLNFMPVVCIKGQQNPGKLVKKDHSTGSTGDHDGYERGVLGMQIIS